MSDARLVDHDDFTGATTLFHYDKETGGFHIEEVQDVESITELTKESYKGIDERAGWKGDWHHVASLPHVILTQLHREGILDDPPRFKKWLNDPDNRVFRTRPGKV